MIFYASIGAPAGALSGDKQKQRFLKVKILAVKNPTSRLMHCYLTLLFVCMKGKAIVRFFALPIVFIILLFGFARTAEAGSWRICILQSARHHALDDVTRGVQQHYLDETIDADFMVRIVSGAFGSEMKMEKIAREIEDYDPHLIIPVGTPAAQFVAARFGRTPAVFSAVTDPVGAGLVADSRRPGGNMTGISDMSPVEAQLEMIRMVQPDIKTLGIVFSGFEQNALLIRDHLKKACERRGIELVEAAVSREESVTASAMAIVERVEALYIATDNNIVSRAGEIAALYTRHGIPLYAGDAGSVSKGAIATLSPDYYYLGVQTGTMSLRILQGAAPSDTPVEKPRKMAIAVNARAAEAIGIDLPMDLILAADTVHGVSSDNHP